MDLAIQLVANNLIVKGGTTQDKKDLKSLS